jgi:hypothetical protein
VSPNPLSQTQTREVAEMIQAEVTRVARRFFIWTGCILVCIAVGAAVGVDAYTHSVHYARTVSCQRGQAFSVALRLVVHTAIPPHRKGRTAAEQQEVNHFYHVVEPALEVPKCN